MGEIRPLVAGNWKMNGVRAALSEIEALKSGLAGAGAIAADVMICPPATLISALVGQAAGSPIGVGGQDCHMAVSGAHTGDISAEMLADAGAAAVIVGHSERRADHGEGDEMIRAKAVAALRAGLTAIICVGESAAERAQGKTLDIVARQLKGSVPAASRAQDTVVAYEPVWAIGTGATPTVEDIAEVHAMIRDALAGALAAGEGAAMRLLYGGSVKPSNAAELLRVANVNGALVGGASLKADDFLGIVSVYGQS